MKHVYNENQSKVRNGMSYLQKYCEGFEKTIEYSQYTGWSPESQAIIDMELKPRVDAIRESVDKIVQEEELTEIYTQLTEKPVANVTVEPDKEEFVLKDTSTGDEISRGNVEIIKGLLSVMNKMQNENGTLNQLQEEKQPIAEKDNGEEPF